MNWFESACRQLGLMLHHVRHPDGQVQRQQVNRQVEEKKVSPTVTLRRTTIEEVEIKTEQAAASQDR